MTSRTAWGRGFSLTLMPTSAPYCLARASFSSEISAAMTLAPNSLATCTAWMATPPPAPMISTSSRGPTLARLVKQSQGVQMASAATAAAV